jgi:hypothetical protein
MAQLRNKSTYDVLFRPAMKAKPAQVRIVGVPRLPTFDNRIVGERSQKISLPMLQNPNRYHFDLIISPHNPSLTSR